MCFTLEDTTTRVYGMRGYIIDRSILHVSPALLSKFDSAQIELMPSSTCHGPMRRQPSSFRHSPQKQLEVWWWIKKTFKKTFTVHADGLSISTSTIFYRCLHFSIGFEKYISKSHQVAYRLQVQEAIHQLHVDALQVAIVLRNLRVAEWPPKLLEFRNGIRLFFENIHWLCQSAFENFKKFPNQDLKRAARARQNGARIPLLVARARAARF